MCVVVVGGGGGGTLICACDVMMANSSCKWC